MTMLYNPYPPWATTNIRALIASTPPLDATARRPVEEEALRRIERQQGLLRRLGDCLDLPPLYARFVQLERAALHYYPRLSQSDRLQFIAANGHNGNEAGARLAYSEREVISILDRAAAILAIREAVGLETDIDDLNEKEAGRLYERWLRR
jgi:hypothetical protein